MRQHIRLELEEEESPLVVLLRGRTGKAEVVLAIRRPNDRILLHTKYFYPEGAFRLPTGGLEEGETPEEAAVREAQEETGLKVKLVSCLGVLEYECCTAREAFTFTSFVFLLDEVGGRLFPEDPGEGITAFQEVEPLELTQVATRLRDMPGDWRDWGRFRAVAHELVAHALAGQD